MDLDDDEEDLSCLEPGWEGCWVAEELPPMPGGSCPGSSPSPEADCADAAAAAAAAAADAAMKGECMARSGRCMNKD